MNYYNYFTEIEEHFVQRRGKYLLISPMGLELDCSVAGLGCSAPCRSTRHRSCHGQLRREEAAFPKGKLAFLL